MSDFLKPTKYPHFICFVCLFHPTYLFSPPKSPLNHPFLLISVVKSKFVCKFIFQLCGFIYATFIFKRFD
ncbi:hypothetical protein DW044_00005 [Lachnospira eligens]|nr:hypothetical protein DW044_00005 [Lachnospira eligens]